MDDSQTVAPNARRKIALSPALSVALDAARASAALYVVAHHIAGTSGAFGRAGLLFRFGQEAVLVFFLLSGFVIFANEHHRTTGTRAYFLRRVRRIYPPLIIAMLVSIVVVWSNGSLQADFSWKELIGNLLSLQDISFLKPGVIVEPFLGNDPLWSLSYEVAFYVFFPIVMKGWNRNPVRTDHVIGLVCCIAYGTYALVPNHFSLVVAYFLLWWTGAMAAATFGQGYRTFLGQIRTLGWMAMLCIVALVVVLLVGSRGLGYYPVLPLRHFIFGILLVILLFGPIGATLVRWIAPFKWAAVPIASISYGLYILHFPLLIRWEFAHSAGGFAVAVGALLVLAWFVDRYLPTILPRAPR